MIERQDPFARFQGVINSLEEIRDRVGEPVVAKVLDHIDSVSRAIIEKSPFIVVASATPDGYPDRSCPGEWGLLSRRLPSDCPARLPPPAALGLVAGRDRPWQ